jgi:hypothetical protein
VLRDIFDLRIFLRRLSPLNQLNNVSLSMSKPEVSVATSNGFPLKHRGLFTLRLAKTINTRSLHLRDVTASGPAQRPYGLPSFGGLTGLGLLEPEYAQTNAGIFIIFPG